MAGRISLLLVYDIRYVHSSKSATALLISLGLSSICDSLSSSALSEGRLLTEVVDGYVWFSSDERNKRGSSKVDSGLVSTSFAL